jgi:hypothetical protein
MQNLHIKLVFELIIGIGKGLFVKSQDFLEI